MYKQVYDWYTYVCAAKPETDDLTSLRANKVLYVAWIDIAVFLPEKTRPFCYYVVNYRDLLDQFPDGELIYWPTKFDLIQNMAYYVMFIMTNTPNIAQIENDLNGIECNSTIVRLQCFVPYIIPCTHDWISTEVEEVKQQARKL